MEQSDPGRADELARQYERRFARQTAYRDRVWRALTTGFFQRYVDPRSSVLDLGSGYGQFINHVQAGQKYAMDLNPDSSRLVDAHTTFFQQDCSSPWPLNDGELDVVFTSNFLEHLPSKDAVRRTLVEARRCIRPGGLILCLGPNVRFVPGAYWDFWDHHVALSDRSAKEVLQLSGFEVDSVIPRFLPYTMAGGREAPAALISMYLRLPFVWPLFGRQFFLVGRRSAASGTAP